MLSFLPLLNYNGRSITCHHKHAVLSTYGAVLEGHADNGIGAEFGVSTPGMNEAIVKTAICKSARRVVLLCDSAKFGNESLVRFADFEDIDTLITDRAPEGELAQAMEGAGVEVIIA